MSKLEQRSRIDRSRVRESSTRFGLDGVLDLTSSVPECRASFIAAPSPSYSQAVPITLLAILVSARSPPGAKP